MPYVDEEQVRVPAQAGPDEQPLVTMAEVAAMTGRPVAAVRAALRRDLARPPGARRWKACKNNAGEWLVAAPAGWPAQADRTYATTPAQADGHTGRLVGDLASRLAELEKAVAGRLAGLERELGAAQVAAAVAAAERNAAERIINELRGELARLRRPWWKRWAEG